LADFSFFVFVSSLFEWKSYQSNKPTRKSLHANDFQGVVPHKFVISMSNLEYLGLHMNGFFGSLQKEIVNMKKLKVLNLFGNYFGGSIPKELAEMKQLEMIDLYANQVGGKVLSQTLTWAGKRLFSFLFSTLFFSLNTLNTYVPAVDSLV
jgi:hypothetical protein